MFAFEYEYLDPRYSSRSSAQRPRKLKLGALPMHTIYTSYITRLFGNRVFIAYILLLLYE